LPLSENYFSSHHVEGCYTWSPPIPHLVPPYLFFSKCQYRPKSSGFFLTRLPHLGAWAGIRKKEIIEVHNTKTRKNGGVGDCWQCWPFWVKIGVKAVYYSVTTIGMQGTKERPATAIVLRGLGGIRPPPPWGAVLPLSENYFSSHHVEGWAQVASRPTF